MDEKFIFTIITTLTATIATCYVAYKNIFSTIRIKVANDQLYNVYLPLFVFLEPYLYKQADINIIRDFIALFNTIKSKHYELIDSNLFNDIQLLERSIKDDTYSNELYDCVCSSLDKSFERKRKFLNLPTRNLLYRINNNQFNSSIKDTFKFILNEFLNLMPFILLLMFFLVLITIILFVNRIILSF